MPEIYPYVFLFGNVTVFGLLFAEGKLLDGVDVKTVKLWASLVMLSAAYLVIYPFTVSVASPSAIYWLHWLLTVALAILMAGTIRQLINNYLPDKPPE